MAQNTNKDPVSASEVRSVKFQLIRRGGYDPGQVDPFLEVVAQALEGGPEVDSRIDAAYVHNVRFTTVRRGGYLPTQVDDFLDRVIDTLKGDARPAPPPPVEDLTSPAETAGDTSASDVADWAPPPAPPPAVSEEQAEAAEDSGAPVVLDEPEQAEPGADAEELAADGADFSPEADFERLRILHDSGVLSDKEFAVLGARVRRRIEAKQSEDSSALV